MMVVCTIVCQYRSGGTGLCIIQSGDGTADGRHLCTHVMPVKIFHQQHLRIYCQQQYRYKPCVQLFLHR